MDSHKVRNICISRTASCKCKSRRALNRQYFLCLRHVEQRNKWKTNKRHDFHTEHTKVFGMPEELNTASPNFKSNQMHN